MRAVSTRGVVHDHRATDAAQQLELVPTLGASVHVREHRGTFAGAQAVVQQVGQLVAHLRVLAVIHPRNSFTARIAL